MRRVESLAARIWDLEKRQFVDWAAVDSCDPAPAEEAARLEAMMLESAGPLKRAFLKILISLCARLVEYGHYKEPDYILGVIWRKVKRLPKSLALGMIDVFQELFIISVMCIAVALVTYVCLTVK